MNCEVGTLAQRRTLRYRAAIRASCSKRFREDCPQLVGFATKCVLGPNDLCPDDKIEPVNAFFGFLDHDGELRDEVWPGPGCAGRAIVRRHRRRTSCQLPGDNICGDAGWKSVNEAQHVNGKQHRSLFEGFTLIAHALRRSIIRSRSSISGIDQLINDDQMTR